MGPKRNQLIILDELLSALIAQGPMRVSRISIYAKLDFGTIRKHLNFMFERNFAEKLDGQIRITPRGRQFHSLLHVEGSG